MSASPGGSRREKIEAMLQDEPQDEFLRYSLALEIAKEGDVQASLDLLRELTVQEHAYVPAFFRCGQLLADEQRTDEARAFLRDGIEEARKQGDAHAAAEMGELLSDLGQHTM